MKKLVGLFILLFAFQFSNAQNSKKETLVVSSSIVCDHCLECESCSGNIYKSMTEVEGVTDVKINQEENTIAVTYKPTKTNPEAIKKAISNSGFDADEVKATPEAYAKLDGCCKAE